MDADVFVRYVYLRGKIDPNFSSSEIWSFIQDSELTNSDKVIWRRVVNCMRAIKALQLDPNLTPEKLKRVYEIIMCEEKHPNGNAW